MKVNVQFVVAGLLTLFLAACKAQQNAPVAVASPNGVMVANEAEIPMVVQEPVLAEQPEQKAAGYSLGPFVSDSDFSKKAIEMGMAHIKLGLLAERKATKGAVRSLGVEFQEEYLRVNGLLMEIARENKWNIPTELSARHQEIFNEMQKLTGEELDRRWLDQVNEDLIAKLDFFKEASGKLSNTRLKNYIIQTSPAAQEYQQRVQELQKKLAADK